MELNKEKLLEIKQGLLMQLDEAKNQLAAVNGAISLINQQLDLLEKPEEKK
jgi:hypothetical protein